jgi:hypothetical protein
MSSMTSFTLNDALSKIDNGYKKTMKGDYNYDYDSDAETVFYDFEEDLDMESFNCMYNSILEKSNLMSLFDGEARKEEETREEDDEEMREEDDEEMREEDDDDDEDSINIIIEDYTWPKIDKADISLSDYEVLQRGYKIMTDKTEMFKRMYKTKKCQKEKCEYSKCPFYHFESERRQGVCAFERGCVNKKCNLKHI